MSHSLFEKGKSRVWNLETFFLGGLGVALIYLALQFHPELSIIEETIILVIFLGALLGVAPISFPNLKGKKYLYPIISGLLSAFMDSFLVLLMVAAIPIKGNKKDVLKFKAYNMIAALIGGLLIYFGEVYALPHYLKYGMHYIYDGLPLLVPVLVFLGILGYFVNKLDLEMPKKETTLDEGLKAVNSEEKISSANIKRVATNYLEFVVGIAIILLTHNAILALGILFAYAFISGQGEDLIHVMKTETEVGVMLLLVLAWVIFEPAQALFASFSGFNAIFPSMVNAVFSGALLPAGGNVWIEIIAISTGALFLPISSLVGVMLFKTLKEWWMYVKISVPVMIIWLVISLSWFTYVWPSIDPAFQKVFGHAAQSAEEVNEKDAELEVSVH